MEKAVAHLELAIDVDSEPISGSVSGGAHGPRPFSGWIDLVAAIEAVRSSGLGSDPSGDTGAQTLGCLPGAKALGL